jgi:hypothetical protein
VEYDQAMPPQPLPLRPDGRGFRGEIKTLDEAASENVELAQRFRIDRAMHSFDGVMHVRLDEEENEFRPYQLSVGRRIGYVVPDLLAVPNVEGTLAAIQRGLICPSEQDLDAVVRGNMPPRASDWIGFHLRVCKACYDCVIGKQTRRISG